METDIAALPWSGIGTALALGFVYFIGAIPAATLLQLGPAWAGVFAWIGYALGGGVVALVGEPFRQWLQRRFGWRLQPDETRWVWRVWRRFGVPGLGLLAPVTCGPQVAVLIGLGTGERPGRLLFWVCVGVIPWTIAFAALTAMGVQWIN